ncbi:hypothetical protein C1H46_027685 [Malus baccata]|uniref:Uncharacterized protein n=1 Tax=Malus baccata TaxID=106549 RepID=A0A540LKK6_MALBA|nr:hypothetical protein C1H46_027685 [Malus baccata]
MPPTPTLETAFDDPSVTKTAITSSDSDSELSADPNPPPLRDLVEIVCGGFLPRFSGDDGTQEPPRFDLGMVVRESPKEAERDERMGRRGAVWVG